MFVHCLDKIGPVIFNNKRLILLSVIQLTGGHYTFAKVNLPRYYLSHIPRWIIRYGVSNLDQSSDKGQTFPIQKIFKHPKYNGLAYYDIAVLQIAPVEFSASLRPICLPDSEEFKLDRYEERASTLIGWGSDGYLGSSSSILKRAILTIYEYR